MIAKDEWWSNHAFNRLEIEIRLHRALHLLFGNELPHTSLQILLSLFDSVWDEVFKEDVSSVLESRSEDRIYKPEVFTKKFYNSDWNRRT